MFEGVSVPEHVVSSPMKLEHGCRGHLLVYEAHIVRLHFLQEFILLQQLYSVTGMSGGGNTRHKLLSNGNAQMLMVGEEGSLTSCNVKSSRSNMTSIGEVKENSDPLQSVPSMALGLNTACALTLTPAAYPTLPARHLFSGRRPVQAAGTFARFT
jgi:hypothetical protein